MHLRQPKGPVTPGQPMDLALNSRGHAPAAAPGSLGNKPMGEDQVGVGDDAVSKVQGCLHAPQNRRAHFGTQARENTGGSLTFPSNLRYPVNGNQASLLVRQDSRALARRAPGVAEYIPAHRCPPVCPQARSGRARWR